MPLNITLPQHSELKPKICVFGVGGAGGNAVNNMINAELQGVDFLVANTDAQALEHSLAKSRIQLGAESTKGLGAGSYPEVGLMAAEESFGDLNSALDKYNMLFITAGMGGGTGTGAAPVIARAARERGILTVGVVTKPFHFEGKRRMDIANRGLEEMDRECDTLIIIPNQNLFRVANEKTTFADAFMIADDVLLRGVQGISDLITMPGLVNLDFADIRTVMSANGGKAMMGTGEAEGEDRAMRAAEAAISNPLLDSSSMRGASGVIINITGSNMTLFEVETAVERVREEVDADANIIFGSAFNKNLENKIQVSVVATGIRFNEDNHPIPSQPKPYVENIIATPAPIAQAEVLDEEAEGAQEYAPEDAESTATSFAQQDDIFLPPEPQEPKNTQSFDHFFNHEEESFPANNSQQDKAAPENISQTEPQKSSISIFGRVAASLAKGVGVKDSKEISASTTQKNEDFFDIPAFMRKKTGDKQ